MSSWIFSGVSCTSYAARAVRFTVSCAEYATRVCFLRVNHARGNWQLASNFRRAKEVSGNFGDWATDPTQSGHEWSLHFSGFVFFLFLNCCRISLSATNLRNNQTSQLTNCALDSENELNLIRQYRADRYFGLSPMYLSEPVKFMVLLISNACLETQTVAAPSTTHSLSAVAENDIGLAS